MKKKILWILSCTLVAFASCKKAENITNTEGEKVALNNKLSMNSLAALPDNFSQIVLATYNLRRDDVEDDPANTWSNRKARIADMITTYKFDIFGTQEGKDNQITDLATLLPAYSHVGVGREANLTGEHVAIFYNKTKFSLLNSGNFWLSGTPDVPGSNTWNGDYKRICTWAKIQDNSSGTFFYYFNTHVDTKDLPCLAKPNSVRLILNKIDEIAGDSPVVLSGDFNFSQATAYYDTLQNSGRFKDAYRLNKYPYNPKGHTYNGYDVNSTSTGRIDHIFVSADFQVDQYGILPDLYNGKFPSDHYPVRIVLNAASKPNQPFPSRAPINQLIKIKGNNNLFVTSNNGTGNMKCDRSTAGSWETFLIESTGADSLVTLKAMNKYVSSENGLAPLTCNRTSPGGWEKFKWIPNSDGTFSLRAANGRYISSGNGTADMTCTSVEVRSWEKFTY